MNSINTNAGVINNVDDYKNTLFHAIRICRLINQRIKSKASDFIDNNIMQAAIIVVDTINNNIKARLFNSLKKINEGDHNKVLNKSTAKDDLLNDLQSVRKLAIKMGLKEENDDNLILPKIMWNCTDIVAEAIQLDISKDIELDSTFIQPQHNIMSGATRLDSI